MKKKKLFRQTLGFLAATTQVCPRELVGRDGNSQCWEPGRCRSAPVPSPFSPFPQNEELWSVPRPCQFPFPCWLGAHVLLIPTTRVSAQHLTPTAIHTTQHVSGGVKKINFNRTTNYWKLRHRTLISTRKEDFSKMFLNLYPPQNSKVTLKTAGSFYHPNKLYPGYVTHLERFIVVLSNVLILFCDLFKVLIFQILI